jgi:hypothetical protein
MATLPVESPPPLTTTQPHIYQGREIMQSSYLPELEHLPSFEAHSSKYLKAAVSPILSADSCVLPSHYFAQSFQSWNSSSHLIAHLIYVIKLRPGKRNNSWNPRTNHLDDLPSIYDTIDH